MVKKIALFAVVIILTAGVVYAKGYTSAKKAGPYQVTLSIEKDPLPVAENKAAIEVRDAAGDYVPDASVEVYYFMPSMPAMNYEMKATQAGKRYVVQIKPTMPGDWKIDVKVRDRKGNLHKASFEFKSK